MYVYVYVVQYVYVYSCTAVHVHVQLYESTLLIVHCTRNKITSTHHTTIQIILALCYIPYVGPTRTTIYFRKYNTVPS